MDLSDGDSVIIYDGDCTTRPVLVEFTSKGVDYEHEYLFTTSNEAFIFMDATSLNPGRGFQLRVVKGEHRACHVNLATTTKQLLWYPIFKSSPWNPFDDWVTHIDFIYGSPILKLATVTWQWMRGYQDNSSSMKATEFWVISNERWICVTGKNFHRFSKATDSWFAQT